MKDLKKLLNLLSEEALDKFTKQVEKEHKELSELIDLFGELTPDCRKQKIQTFKVILETHLKYGNADGDCYCELKSNINKIGDK